MKTLFLTLTSFLFLILAVASTASAEEVTRPKTIKNFFKANTELRVSEGAATAYHTTLNALSLNVIQKAQALAREEDRKTILERDIAQASDQVFRRAPLNVSELMEKINQLSIIELSELTNHVKIYQEALLEKPE